MDSIWTDIHSHILPGIDDGANDWSESVEMLKYCWRNGIGKVIVTPHFHYKIGQASPEKIISLTEELAERAEEEKIPVKLYTGNELYYTNDLLAAVKAGGALTLAGSDYVLLEFPINTEQRKIQNAVYEFLNEGYIPVLAHIERYEAFLRDFGFAEDILKMGAYFQMNAESILGNVGWEIRRFSRKMIKSGKIQLIASDAHDMKKRVPDLERVAGLLKKKYGSGEVRRCLTDNPQCIIENRGLFL